MIHRIQNHQPTNSAQPLVTAVLVCWNHERFVRASVLSALQQTYSNIQLIVFDNGSTDNSPRELERVAKENDFTLVTQANIGLVRALNKGLAMAEGKYFAILATDDIWLPEKTERQVAFLEANPNVHMLAGLTQPIDENGEHINYPVTNRPGEVTFLDLMQKGCNVFGATVMCRTETLRHFGGYDESVRIEDYTMALRFSHDGYRIVIQDEVCTLYRRHLTNWTNRPYWAERMEIGERYRGDSEYTAFIRHNLQGYFRWLASERKSDALRLLLKEPIAWSWNDVGVGLLKLMVPSALVRWRRRMFYNK